MENASLEQQLQLRALALQLERLCSLNSDLRSTSPTIFDAISVPAMSIHCYLVRIRRYTKFDFNCFMVAVGFINQLCVTRGPAFCPTMHNIHRLLITSLLVASKAADDVFHANLFMAQCGGIGVTELNNLELEMCTQLEWKLMPQPQHLQDLYEALDDLQADYWHVWSNTPPRSSLHAVPTEEGVASPSPLPLRSAEAQASSTPLKQPRGMSHSKSLQESLGRLSSLFTGGLLSAGHGGRRSSGRSSGSRSSREGDCDVLRADAEASLTCCENEVPPCTAGTPKQSKLGWSPKNSSAHSSPRSVLGRNFSFSQLLGLGWSQG